MTFLIPGMTKDIAEAIDKVLMPLGVAVTCEATHMVRNLTNGINFNLFKLT